MDIRDYNAYSFSFIGDAVYTLAVREYFVERHYQSSKKLQILCNRYNSAAGQAQAFHRLNEEGFFSEEELAIYKKGRNHINHIPKNSDLSTYECASGLEAICGYLYLTDKDRLKAFFAAIFTGGKEDE